MYRSELTCALALAVLCWPAEGRAAETPADWVVWFQDNFEDATLRRWQIGFDQSAPGANWIIQKDGDNTVMAGREHIFAAATPVIGSNYRFRARVKLISGWLNMNARDRCTRYSVRLDANWVSLTRTAPCMEHTAIRTVHEPFGLNRWHVLEIVAIDDEIKVYVNDALKISFKDETPVVFGGVNFETLQGSSAQVDDVEVSGPPRTASALQVMDYALPEGVVGSSYSHQLTAVGGTPPYKWGLLDAPAPAGLALSHDGEVSGRPEKEGWQPVTVKVMDSEGRQSFETLGFDVEGEAILNSPLLPPGEVGRDYSVQLQAAGMPEGGRWLALNLPPGLKLDPVTGVVSGVPALGGAYTVFAVCMGGDDDAALKLFGFYASEANPTPLRFVTQPEELWDLGAGEVSLSGEFAVTGGTPPYQWAIVEGDLPAGTRLISGNALLERSPLTAAVGGLAMSAEKRAFKVEATDAAGAKVAREYEIESSWIQFDSEPDLDEIVTPMGRAVQIQLSARNAIGKVTWEAVNLPAGLEFSADGKLTGALKECGLLWMTLKVSDQDQPPAGRRFGVLVFGLCSPENYAVLDIHIPGWVIRGKAGEPFELRFGVGNGSGQGYRLSVVDGSLPPGLELHAGDLPGAFALSGTPTAAGSYEAYLSAEDSSGVKGQRRLRISLE